MTAPFFNAEQLATEWATKICQRLEQIGVPEHERQETQTIILAFTRIAAEELSNNRQVSLPHGDKPFEIDAKHAHQIIDLFLRGVNQVAKKLRDSGLPWEERRDHLETIAWKLFNLAKLLVGSMYMPNPDFPKALNSDKDLQLVMKQTAETLYREQMTGKKSMTLPWMNFRP